MPVVETMPLPDGASSFRIVGESFVEVQTFIAMVMDAPETTSATFDIPRRRTGKAYEATGIVHSRI